MVMLALSADELLLAQQCLLRAESGFASAHGAQPGLDRLLKLKGEHCVERVLYVRLHFLQATVALMQGEVGRGRALLLQAKGECEMLLVHEREVEAVASIARVKRQQAQRALRATAPETSSSGSVVSPSRRGASPSRPAADTSGTQNGGTESTLRVRTAVLYAIERREERKRKAETEKARQQDRKLARKYGRTLVGGELVDMPTLRTLEGMGFDGAMAVEALRRSDNSQEAAMNLLTNGSLSHMLDVGFEPAQAAFASAAASAPSMANPEMVALVLSMVPTASKEQAGEALVATNNNVDDAVMRLVTTMSMPPESKQEPMQEQSEEDMLAAAIAASMAFSGDGESQPPVPTPVPQLVIAAPSDSIAVNLGSKVLARCKRSVTFYGGTIVKDNGDCTYEVIFDDGDCDRAVPKHCIKAWEETSQAAAKQDETGAAKGAEELEEAAVQVHMMYTLVHCSLIHYLSHTHSL
jgi:hypothetical protein